MLRKSFRRNLANADDFRVRRKHAAQFEKGVSSQSTREYYKIRGNGCAVCILPIRSRIVRLYIIVIQAAAVKNIRQFVRAVFRAQNEYPVIFGSRFRKSAAKLVSCMLLGNNIGVNPMLFENFRCSAANCRKFRVRKPADVNFKSAHSLQENFRTVHACQSYHAVFF